MTTITTYSELTNALQEWLDGADSVTSHPDQMIFLAEAYFRRSILHLDREGDATLSTTSGEISLPADFLQARFAYLDTDPTRDLDAVSPGVLRSHWAASRTGLPLEYAIKNGTMLLGPAPDDTYDLILTYSRKLIGLSDSVASNWLLESHPDVYLYGAMMHAEFYASNDVRADTAKNVTDQIIASINAEGERKRLGGTIKMGTRVQERL